MGKEQCCCEDFWEHLADCVDGTIDDVKDKAKTIVFTGLSLLILVPCGVMCWILSYE